jgi:hypothetical protein
MVNLVVRLSIAGPLALAIVSGLASVSPAHAGPCRDTVDVQASADPDKNTGMHGHITQHILGMRPPQDKDKNGKLLYSQDAKDGKTLFADKTKAQAAWRQYQYISNPVGCSGKEAHQSVSLHDLKMNSLDAYSCTAANANGECTAKTLYVAESVFFAFNNDPTYKWILVTMYPEPLK